MSIKLYTVSDIARLAKVKPYVVEYYLRTHPMREVARAGLYRLFDAHQCNTIIAAVKKPRKTGRPRVRNDARH